MIKKGCKKSRGLIATGFFDTGRPDDGKNDALWFCIDFFS
ncbi:hypothetical protein CHK_2035 [Christensenella hongkongensis]|uniref:Uncharacterized protein n=1 Tax=Christensenella hongkongensis TaxID=270498 RepID=A0A0M2NE29_9FIRM|nr:hypothetical protein CHK_2035 [Christensenella hongkongensis]